jgi:hypothetical protein
MKFVQLVAIVVLTCAASCSTLGESRKLAAEPDREPKVEFFDYSGEDAIVSCAEQPSKKLETGEMVSVPYTHSSQACSVTLLKTGKYVPFVVSQVLPGSSNSGLSVSVDIDETYLFFTLNDTDEHAFVNYRLTSDDDHTATEPEEQQQTPITNSILSQ